MSVYGKSTFQNGFAYFEEYRDPDDIGVRDLSAELGLKGLETLGGQNTRTARKTSTRQTLMASTATS